MYEVFWKLCVAIMEVVVSLKTSIGKYVAYKPNNKVSANRVNI